MLCEGTPLGWSTILLYVYGYCNSLVLNISSLKLLNISYIDSGFK